MTWKIAHVGSAEAARSAEHRARIVPETDAPDMWDRPSGVSTRSHRTKICHKYPDITINNIPGKLIIL
jgi:hypothetical protein